MPILFTYSTGHIELQIGFQKVGHPPVNALFAWPGGRKGVVFQEASYSSGRQIIEAKGGGEYFPRLDAIPQVTDVVVKGRFFCQVVLEEEQQFVAKPVRLKR